MKWIIIATALAVSPSALGQQIYKCAGVYQQTPCAGNAKPEKVIRYTPSPAQPAQSSGDFSFTGEVPGSARTYPTQRTQAARQQVSQDGAFSDPSPSDPHIQDRLRSIASDPAYKGSPSARRAAMNAVLQESGYQSAGPYQAPSVASPADGIGQPANVIDQQTGMPINGAIKVAPNRIWDPNTGQYRDTY